MAPSSIHRRTLLFAMAGLSSAAVVRSGAAARNIPMAAGTAKRAWGGAGPAGPLADAARASGRFFGAAVRPDLLRDAFASREGLLSNCACLTPEIHLKWNALEPRKDEFNYNPVDDLLNYATARKLFVRGHTLIWERSTPDWAKAEIAAKRDRGLVSGHFARTLGPYRQTITEWDVVNEPLDTVDGVDGLRRTTFFDAFGPSYIRRALDEARDHAPDAHLLINDYGFEYGNPTESDRRRAFLALLKDLVTAGAPIDGVGLQAHLDLGKGRLADREIGRFLSSIRDLGLSITISELDVKEVDIGAPIAVRDRRVADEVQRYLDIVLMEPAVRGIVTWGLSDRYSWLSEGDGAGGPAAHDLIAKENRGLPFDRAYRPKPMYLALLDRLRTSSQTGIAYQDERFKLHRAGRPSAA